jgi:iron(III) transport system substrate-binding protein
MRRHRRLVAALAGAALLLPAAAACGSDDAGNGNGPDNASDTDGADDKADEELGNGGKLLIYSGRNEELIQPLIDQLEAATGLEVDVRYGDSAELAAQLLEEGTATNAGLFLSQDAGALGALSKADLLDEIPEGLLNQVDAAYSGSAGDWVGISGRARVVAYNSDNVDEADLPQSIHDLTGPEWKGKVGYAPTNASFQSFVTALRVLEGEDGAKQWLTDLKANDAQVYEKNGAILDAVDAGEVDAGLINHYYWYAKAAELGEDTLNAKLHFLPGGDPGTLINVAGVGITAHGGQQPEARQALEFFLSEQAQLYFAEETKEYPLAAGVTSPVEALPPLEGIEAPAIDLTDLDSLEATLELLQEVGMV